jgi:predicted HTH domain antitoxin
MTLPLPAAAARAFGENAEAKVRLLAAVKAYELDELGVNQAAELAGVTKVEFLQRLGEFQVSAIATLDLEHDLEVARRASGR